MISELELFEKELAEWQNTIQQYLDRDDENAKNQTNDDNTSETVMKLRQFKGVGERLSRHLPWEIGDFQRVDSAKQYAAFFGLTPCPFGSGTMNREPGSVKPGEKVYERWQ